MRLIWIFSLIYFKCTQSWDCRGNPICTDHIYHYQITSETKTVHCNTFHIGLRNDRKTETKSYKNKESWGANILKRKKYANLTEKWIKTGPENTSKTKQNQTKISERLCFWYGAKEIDSQSHLQLSYSIDWNKWRTISHDWLNPLRKRRIIFMLTNLNILIEPFFIRMYLFFIYI